MGEQNSETLALFCDAPMSKVITETTCLPLTTFHALPEFILAAHESHPVATFIDAARGDASQSLLAVSDVVATLPYSPCIVLVPESDVALMEKAFATGAHDAIRKPLRPSELLARLQLRIRDLRRLQNTHEVRVGDLVINQMTRIVQKGRHHTQLSSTAFTALRILAETPDMVAKRSFLMERVWPAVKVAEGTLDRHIYEIRKAFLTVGSAVSIGSVYGEGFVLTTTPETGSEHPEAAAASRRNRLAK